jgi:hypothetical protein
MEVAQLNDVIVEEAEGPHSRRSKVHCCGTSKSTQAHNQDGTLLEEGLALMA